MFLKWNIFNNPAHWVGRWKNTVSEINNHAENLLALIINNEIIALIMHDCLILTHSALR